MDTDIRRVLRYVPLRPGNLMLARTGDGRLCIVRNDEPVDGYHWDAADMAKALATFRQLSVRHLTGIAPAPSDVLGSCAGRLGPPCLTPPQV